MTLGLKKFVLRILHAPAFCTANRGPLGGLINRRASRAGMPFPVIADYAKGRACQCTVSHRQQLVIGHMIGWRKACQVSPVLGCQKSLSVIDSRGPMKRGGRTIMDIFERMHINRGCG